MWMKRREMKRESDNVNKAKECIKNVLYLVSCLPDAC